MPASDIHSILTALERSGSNTTSFGANWSQGRSAFGGLASCFAVTAMRHLLNSPQPIRSLMVSFIAPLPPGEISVDARIHRQGRNVTQASADVISNGTICLQAMAVFGNPRAALKVSPDYVFQPRPRDQGLAFEANAERLPNFLQYFDGYWVGGGQPFAGKLDRQLTMWVRHRAEMTSMPVERLVTIADIPPPLILSHYHKPPVPASSLTWSLEFVIPPEDAIGDWFYLEYYLEAAADGYTQQAGKVWDESGQLCALSRQCMVYFE